MTTKFRNQMLRKEAKALASNFLSRGMSMQDLSDYGDFLKQESSYQVEHNTIEGLSNGVIVD